MKPTRPTPPEDPIRPHVFDGIAEYDKSLPNWWLYTLYVSILFAIGYWGYYEWLKAGPNPQQEVVAAMAKIEAGKLVAAKVDDATLWKMSQSAAFVDSGRATYAANCAACHLPSLRGKGESSAAIGPDLTDTTWLHGGKPTEVLDLITKGVLTKGMPAWGPVLGTKKITEVTAFILSKHQEGEPVLREQGQVASQ
jgi:cytochrome c oxidase cbb3-type subunit III